MDQQGIYLYCFTRAGTAVGDLGTPADGGPDVAALDVGQVTAVISRVGLGEFSAASPSARGEDPEWVVSRACRHERIIEQTMRAGPVLPVKFGTVFSSEQALRTAMRQMGDGIAHVLARLVDKEEWAVKVFVDDAKAREWLLATDPILAARQRNLPESPGLRYLQARRIDDDADRALRRRRTAVAEEIQGEFRDCGAAMHPLKLQPKGVSGRDADMVLHLAMFMNRNDVPVLEARVRRLGAAYAGRGIALEVTGPWPPYHFCPPPEATADEASSVLHST